MNRVSTPTASATPWACVCCSPIRRRMRAGGTNLSRKLHMRQINLLQRYLRDAVLLALGAFAAPAAMATPLAPASLASAAPAAAAAPLPPASAVSPSATVQPAAPPAPEPALRAASPAPAARAQPAAAPVPAAPIAPTASPHPPAPPVPVSPATQAAHPSLFRGHAKSHSMRCQPAVPAAPRRQARKTMAMPMCCCRANAS